MRFFVVFFLPILFGVSLTQDASVENRKSNIVVGVLDSVLENVIKEMTTKNSTIPLVDLEENGKIENIIINVQKMTKWTDGIGEYGFQLRTNLSEIRTSGYYDIEDLELPGLFPLFGKGDFLIAVEEATLRLKVKAMFNYNTGQMDFKVSDFNVQVVNSTVKFDNLMGDPNVSDFLNELIQNLIPHFVEAFRPILSFILEQLINVYGNGILYCIKNELNDLNNCIKKLFETVVEDVRRLI